MKRTILMVLFAFGASLAYVSAQENIDKDIYGLWQFAEERVAPDGTVQRRSKISPPVPVNIRRITPLPRRKTSSHSATMTVGEADGIPTLGSTSP